MKELDLTNAKLLKLWLRMGYCDWEISNTKDICSLTRMVLWSGVCGIRDLILAIFVLAALLGGLWGIALMFSFLTLYLPEAYWASPDRIGFGLFALGVTSLATVTGGFVLWCNGDIRFAPEYMKRPLRKLFNKTTSEEKFSEKKPSQTWIALKEIGKAWKEKTCIKVKL
jgi:hypothetical protein